MQEKIRVCRLRVYGIGCMQGAEDADAESGGQIAHAVLSNFFFFSARPQSASRTCTARHTVTPKSYAL